jgi:hypothetical protein
MRTRARLRPSLRVLMLMVMIALSTGATAWGQGAGPFDTYTVSPCRVLDTRISVPLGPIPGNGTRSILVTADLTAGGTINQGGATTCGVPDTAAGVFINVVAVTASGPGHLTAYPFGTSLPLASTLNFATGQTVANGVLVPVCTPAGGSCDFDLNITMGPSSAHIVIDVTGYLLPTP